MLKQHFSNIVDVAEKRKLALFVTVGIIVVISVLLVSVNFIQVSPGISDIEEHVFDTLPDTDTNNTDIARGTNIEEKLVLDELAVAKIRGDAAIAVGFNRAQIPTGISDIEEHVFDASQDTDISNVGIAQGINIEENPMFGGLAVAEFYLKRGNKLGAIQRLQDIVEKLNAGIL